jgi:hypothetical protein
MALARVLVVDDVVRMSLCTILENHGFEVTCVANVSQARRDLLDAITQRLAKGPLHKRKIETLATILERTTEAGIDDWYAEVKKEETLTAVHLSHEARC